MYVCVFRKLNFCGENFVVCPERFPFRVFLHVKRGNSIFNAGHENCIVYERFVFAMAANDNPLLLQQKQQVTGILPQHAIEE